jgi:hypothetical protein
MCIFTDHFSFSMLVVIPPMLLVYRPSVAGTVDPFEAAISYLIGTT